MKLPFSAAKPLYRNEQGTLPNPGSVCVRVRNDGNTGAGKSPVI